MNGDMSKGMHWVGHPGSLHPVIDFGMVAVDDELAPVFDESLGGGVRAAVPVHRPLRSWGMDVPNAHSDQMSHFRDLLTTTFPPYVLVTAEAQVSNVLTPDRAAMLDSGLGMAGARLLDGGGFSTTSRANPNAAFGNVAQVLVGPAPTPPVWTGRKVTVSAWLGTARAEGAHVTLYWLDAAGAVIEPPAHVGNAVTGMDMLRRSTATGTPPSGAVACRVAIRYAEVIAQPQVTWTDAPVPEWSPGNGADHVVPVTSSRSTRFAVPDDYNMRRSDYSIGFREVGPA